LAASRGKIDAAGRMPLGRCVFQGLPADECCVVRNIAGSAPVLRSGLRNPVNSGPDPGGKCCGN
jgi:hypothetical protein